MKMFYNCEEAMCIDSWMVSECIGNTIVKYSCQNIIDSFTMSQ